MTSSERATKPTEIVWGTNRLKYSHVSRRPHPNAAPHSTHQAASSETSSNHNSFQGSSVVQVEVQGQVLSRPESQPWKRCSREESGLSLGSAIDAIEKVVRNFEAFHEHVLLSIEAKLVVFLKRNSGFHYLKDVNGSLQGTATLGSSRNELKAFLQAMYRSTSMPPLFLFFFAKNVKFSNQSSLDLEHLL